MATCPNCKTYIQWDREKCPVCSAIFNEADALPPIGDTSEEKSKIAQLMLQRSSKPNSLPFASWWPVLAGILAGLALRLIFSGQPGGPFAAMMASFIYLCPMLVGVVTVYMAERKQRRSWFYYFWASFLANVFFVGGTLLIMIEGLICAIVIVPVFAIVGSFGGLLMGVVCRVTKWPKHTLYSFWILPLVLGGVEGNVKTPSRFGSVEHTIQVKAPPEVVWRQIMEARDIQPDEMGAAWIFRIGVPLPLAGVMEPESSSLVRKITMGKNVHFEQVFTDWQENRYVHFNYRISKDSFPPYALDDHVLVGGYYFDVKDTSYTLTPNAQGTELRIRMGYRVTTQFNWYAEPLARSMLGNFEEVVLSFYQRRSEREAGEVGL